MNPHEHPQHQTVTPKAPNALTDPGTEPARRQRAAAIGWSASVFLHLLLLIGFTGVTLFSGLDQGQEGLEGGLVLDDSGPAIELSTPAEPIEPAAADLTAPAIQTGDAIEPITDLGGAAGATGADPIESVQLSAAGGSAVGGDWSSLVTAGGGPGGRGGASFFGLQAKGESFVYVVDYSGSMNGDRVAAAKAELIRSISALGRTSRFYIFFYDDKYIRMPNRGLVRASSANKRKYFAWVAQAAGGGGTDPREAMKEALALRPDAIYLLSDGEFAEAAADEIRAANPGARVQINTIAFHSNSGESILQRIAEENRGQYRFVPPGGLPWPGGGP